MPASDSAMMVVSKLRRGVSSKTPLSLTKPQSNPYSQGTQMSDVLVLYHRFTSQSTMFFSSPTAKMLIPPALRAPAETPETTSHLTSSAGKD
jgi:hypothetical protein